MNTDVCTTQEHPPPKKIFTKFRTRSAKTTGVFSLPGNCVTPLSSGRDSPELDHHSHHPQTVALGGHFFCRTFKILFSTAQRVATKTHSVCVRVRVYVCSPAQCLPRPPPTFLTISFVWAWNTLRINCKLFPSHQVIHPAQKLCWEQPSKAAGQPRPRW